MEDSKKESRQCLSIYIHIPFCERKCNYCAFNSFCTGDEEKEKYIGLLCKEIEVRAKAEGAGKVVRTIYIGGGTPSVLTETQIEKVVNCLRENFEILPFAEFTIEANPNSITEQKLAVWRKLGINRLSIGVQSLSDRSLKKIGRLHDKKMALEKIALARKTFDNVSCDLIVGLEGESGKDLCRYAKELLALGIKHISCYLLEIYDATVLHSMVLQNKYKPLNDDETISAFNKLSSYLQDAGMTRYEISNFAFEGYESKHNLNYWARGEYLGFGISAHSFVNGQRLENAGGMEEYEKGVQKSEMLSAKEENEEKIMLGLRCCLGVDLKSLKNYDITKNPYFAEYVKQGILMKKGDIVTLNPLYYHISNTIISNLFS